MVCLSHQHALLAQPFVSVDAVHHRATTIESNVSRLTISVSLIKYSNWNMLFLYLSCVWAHSQSDNNRCEWHDQTIYDIKSTSSNDDNSNTDVGKLVSPCGTLKVLSQNSTHIADGHSPSNLVPTINNHHLNMSPYDPMNLSQTSTTTTGTQKDEWFV